MTTYAGTAGDDIFTMVNLTGDGRGGNRLGDTINGYAGYDILRIDGAIQIGRVRNVEQVELIATPTASETSHLYISSVHSPELYGTTLYSGTGTVSISATSAFYNDIPEILDASGVTVEAGSDIGFILETSSSFYDETIIGTSYNDTLGSNGGVDHLAGGPGDDFYLGDSDVIITENGGEGIDTVRSRGSFALPPNVEHLEIRNSLFGAPPGQFNVVVGTGNALNNHISVYTGDGPLYFPTIAILKGQGGNDVLLGGADIDILIGGTGADTMIGRNGPDTYFVENVGDVVIENGTTGTDKVVSSIDYALGSSVEQLDLTQSANRGTGNALDNLVRGNDVDNVLMGLDGNDTLNGLGGDDRLAGGTGDDSLIGGTGNDMLAGGAGRDVLRGGADADIFRWNGHDFAGLTLSTADRILDFSQADGDVIDLGNVDAVAGGADDPFTFIGTAAFSGTAGELRFEQFAHNTLISGDTDGDGNADFAIRLDGVINLTAADFVL